MKMNMTRQLTLAIVLCLTLVAHTTRAHAESELYKFCKNDLNTSEEIKASIGSITMGTMLFKAVLAVTANVIIINKVNQETLKITSNQAELAERIFPVFAPSTRAFFKALVPTLKAADGQLSKTDSYFKKLFYGKLNQDGLTTNSVYAQHPVVSFYKNSLKFFKYWDVVAGSIIAYQVAAKITCEEVKKAHQNCMNKAKDKTRCDLSFNDLPDANEDQSVEKTSCSADDAVQKYTALMTQLAPMVRQMRTANKKILAALKPLKAIVSKATSVLNPLKAPLNAADSAVKKLKSGLAPFKFLANQIKNVLGKRICVKFKIKIGNIKKQTQKCSRPKNLIKTIKKYTEAAQKAFKVAMKKLIDPIMNKIKDKIMKIPGVSKMQNSVKKLADNLNVNKKLDSVSKLLGSIPGATFTTKLKDAATQIRTLNAQMSH